MHNPKAMTPAQYANEWSVNAKTFASEGHYAWMAEQLGAAKTVLEIGCGPGESTLAVAQDGRRIISIEINQQLISQAASLLRANGITVEITTLADLSKATLSKTVQVTLVDANVFDKDLHAALVSLEFDSIVCWLIGADPGAIADFFKTPLTDTPLVIQQTPQYRISTQKRCYELGTKLIKSGGCVHIVDRQGIRSWSDKDHGRHALSEAHAGMAGQEYSVTKETTLLRKLDSLGGSHIQHLVAGGQTAPVTVLGSVRAMKR